MIPSMDSDRVELPRGVMAAFLSQESSEDDLLTEESEKNESTDK
jgi:hypothetical protein